MGKRRDPKQVVANSYDLIGTDYSDWVQTIESGERDRCIQWLVDNLPPDSSVLDLGCGIGVPRAKCLAEKFKVTGVDISSENIRFACENVPGAEFFCVDMTQVNFPAASFDGIVAFYSIIHVPRKEHEALLEGIHRWLKPGGVFLATMGVSSVSEEYQDDWLGVPMYWSSYDSSKNQRLIEDAGMCIESAIEETAKEDGIPVTFLWVTARKPI